MESETLEAMFFLKQRTLKLAALALLVLLTGITTSRGREHKHSTVSILTDQELRVIVGGATIDITNPGSNNRAYGVDNPRFRYTIDSDFSQAYTQMYIDGNQAKHGGLFSVPATVQTRIRDFKWLGLNQQVKIKNCQSDGTNCTEASGDDTREDLRLRADVRLSRVKFHNTGYNCSTSDITSCSTRTTQSAEKVLEFADSNVYTSYEDRRESSSNPHVDATLQGCSEHWQIRTNLLGSSDFVEFTEGTEDCTNIDTNGSPTNCTNYINVVDGFVGSEDDYLHVVFVRNLERQGVTGGVEGVRPNNKNWLILQEGSPSRLLAHEINHALRNLGEETHEEGELGGCTSANTAERNAACRSSMGNRFHREAAQCETLEASTFICDWRENQSGCN